MTNVMNLGDLRFPLKAAAMVAGQCGGAVLAAGTKSIIFFVTKKTLFSRRYQIHLKKGDYFAADT